MDTSWSSVCGPPKITLVDTETSPLSSVINHASVIPDIAPYPMPSAESDPFVNAIITLTYNTWPSSEQLKRSFDLDVIV